MAIKTIFGGKIIIEPGAYATQVSGVTNQAQPLPYGNVLIIDTGKGAGYNIGAGTIQTTPATARELNPVYAFDNSLDLKKHLVGGDLYSISDSLFSPAGAGIAGAPSVTVIKAASTDPATLALSFTSGGSITLYTKGEGVGVNGALKTGETGSSPTDLKSGYAVEVVAGTIDTNKFVINFYKGNYTGVYSGDGLAWNEIAEADAPVSLIASTGEISTVADFLTWSQTSFGFNQNFRVSASTAGVLDVDTTGLQLFASGTEDYAAVGAVQAALDLINDLDISLIILDDYEADAYSATNQTIANWVGSSSEFGQGVYVAGRTNRVDFNNGASSSVGVANSFNSSVVTVVHGGIKKRSTKVVGGFRDLTSFQHLGYQVGRRAGLAPQNPATFKSIGIDGLVHTMTTKERETGINNGVLFSFFDNKVGYITIRQDINTNQSNNNLINPDSTSYENSIEYIKRQLNKELVVNARRDLLVDENGVTITSLTPADVKSYTKSYLKTKEGNLIQSFSNVVVSRIAGSDAYNVSYEYVPSYPVNKLLFTGIITDVNLTA